jgi:hypothetical protein
MKTLLAAIAILMLSGCGTVSTWLGQDANTQIDKYGKKLADAYCKQPFAVRETDSRPRVNAAISPHKIKLDCYGDPDNPMPAQ